MSYLIAQVYDLVSRPTVSDILSDLKYYDNLFILLEDGDEPTPVRSCISYLESLPGHRTISIMSYEGEQTRWT